MVEKRREEERARKNERGETFYYVYNNKEQNAGTWYMYMILAAARVAAKLFEDSTTRGRCTAIVI